MLVQEPPADLVRHLLDFTLLELNDDRGVS